MSTGLPILIGMNRLGKHIYSGTVDPAVVAKRRSRNKQASITGSGASRASPVTCKSAGLRGASPTSAHTPHHV